MAEQNQGEFEFLKGSPAFDGLGDEDIRSILSKAKPISFARAIAQAAHLLRIRPRYANAYAALL